MKKITNTEYRQGKISDLSAFIKELLKDYEVIAPVKKEDKMIQFDRIENADEINIEIFPQAQLSFKQWLLPRDQVLLKYQLDKTGITMDNSTDQIPKRRVIFGLHSCDLHAVEVLDRIFLEEKDPDQAYKYMRENTLLIGVGCSEPFDNCFCGSMKTEKPPENIYTLFFYKDGDKFYATAISEIGQNLLKKLKTTEMKDGEKKIDKILKNLVEHEKLEMSEINLTPLLIKTYGDEFWNDLGGKCFGCAGCTSVCPTCYCFVVDDIVDGSSKKKMYKRVRDWDSCTLTNWALAAGGHNFQHDRGLRLHRRFMHKFSQVKEKIGMVACIGCGRCVAICPTGAGNPVTVIKDLIKSNT